MLSNINYKMCSWHTKTDSASPGASSCEANSVRDGSVTFQVAPSLAGGGWGRPGRSEGDFEGVGAGRKMWEEGGSGGRLGGEQDPLWTCQRPGQDRSDWKKEMLAGSVWSKDFNLEWDSQSGRLRKKETCYFVFASSSFDFKTLLFMLSGQS